MSKPQREFLAYPPQSLEPLRVVGLLAFSRQHGMSPGDISKCLKGDRGECKGWRFRETDNPIVMFDNEENKPEPKVPAINPIPKRDRDDTESDFIKKVKAWAQAEMLSLMKSVSHFTANPSETPPKWNAKQTVETIRAIVESQGIDWESIQDTRSEDDRAMDAVRMLLAQPEAIYELLDEQIESITGLFNLAHHYGERYIRCLGQRATPVQHAFDPEAEPQIKDIPKWMMSHDPKALGSSIDKWMTRLFKLKTLRMMVRTPVPKCYEGHDRISKHAAAATQILRYMVYVGRTDMNDSSGSALLRIGKHHVQMAVDMYRMKYQAVAHQEFGLLLRGEPVADAYGNVRRYPGAGQTGFLGMYPPGHGKTLLLRHFVGLEMAMNTRVQIAYIHAREKEAVAFNRYVQTLFIPEKAPGRRNLSLFPNRLSDIENNATQTRLVTDDPPKNPNLMGFGVKAQAAGNNFDVIIFDDVVPQDDAYQPQMREWRKKQFAGTWLVRLRGDLSYFMVWGYPSHHEDLIWTLKKDADTSYRTKNKSVNGRNIIVSKAACGGPTSEPKYKSIWPEVYSRKWLRRRRQAMGNAALWAAQYELNPISDEDRIIRKVRLYDPNPQNDPDQHQRFLRNARIHLSVDPSFTNTSKSDKAGLVIVGIGLVDSSETTFGGTKITSRRVIRVLREAEIKATQKELSDTVADIARSRRVDMVHVERAGGSTAFSEFMLALHGIESVYEHPVGPKDKGRRLREVASMIEADAIDITPVVELPGVWEEGRKGRNLVVDPAVKTLWNYIVNFRAASGYHSLDAFTQVVAYLAPEVGIGTAAATSEARRHEPTIENRKVKAARMEREARARLEEVGILSYCEGSMV